MIRNQTWTTSVVMMLLMLGAMGCRRQSAPPLQVDTAAPPQTETPRKNVISEESKSVSRDIASDVPVLAHGTHMVFGIRIPGGMMPIEAGDKVKRFEGTHPIESVKRYIVEQLAGKVDIRPNRFGDGYFIANAIPASSQRDLSHVDSAAKKYNIKIFDGSIGGAGIDIWEALPGESANDVSPGVGSAMRNLKGYPGGKAMKRGDAPKIKYRTPRQRDRATFNAIDKLSKGKPLTDADYQSPYFTEI